MFSKTPLKRYESVAARITKDVEELVGVTEECGAEISRLDAEIAALEEAKAGATSLANKAAKLQANLQKLFD